MIRVAVPGAFGAFSHLAAAEVFPAAAFVFFPTFAQVLNAVKDERVDAGVVPVENSLAGRVTDIHRLLPSAGVCITGEHFLRIEHHLCGMKGAKPEDVKTVYSHAQALAQCSLYLTKTGVKTRACENTALAARAVAEQQDKSCGAVASQAAAKQYGLKILKRNIEDSEDNRTRFLILSKTQKPVEDGARVITSFVFFVKHEPAALYHALGVFAAGGINLLRLESYVDSKNFTSAGFFADVSADLTAGKGKEALDDLRKHTLKVTVLGRYPASPLRPEA